MRFVTGPLSYQVKSHIYSSAPSGLQNNITLRGMPPTLPHSEGHSKGATVDTRPDLADMPNKTWSDQRIKLHPGGRFERIARGK